MTDRELHRRKVCPLGVQTDGGRTSAEKVDVVRMASAVEMSRATRPQPQQGHGGVGEHAVRFSCCLCFGALGIGGGVCVVAAAAVASLRGSRRGRRSGGARRRRGGGCHACPYFAVPHCAVRCCAVLCLLPTSFLSRWRIGPASVCLPYHPRRSRRPPSLHIVPACSNSASLPPADIHRTAVDTALAHRARHAGSSLLPTASLCMTNTMHCATCQNHPLSTSESTRPVATVPTVDAQTADSYDVASALQGCRLTFATRLPSILASRSVRLVSHSS